MAASKSIQELWNESIKGGKMGSQVIQDPKKTNITPETLKSDVRIIKKKLNDSAMISAFAETLNSGAKTTYKNLRKKSTEIQLRTLARISDNVSKALNIYQGFCNSGWAIDAESNRAERALTEWFEEMSDIGINANNLVNQNIYDLYILGAMCMRTVLINNEPKFIRNIPPENISFLHQVDPDPANIDYGKIWYKGFYLENSRTDFVVLESILDPNEYFYYGTMLEDSTNPKGISIIESVIDLAISAGEKDYLLTEYLRGSIFPHEIVSLILADYFKVLADENIEFDVDKFNEIKKDAVDKVNKFIDEGDSTQTLSIDVPVEKTVIGTLEGNNLRGLSDINDSHSESFPRALKAPSVLLGSRRQGSALNDTESKYEIRSFYKNVLNIRGTVRGGWEKLCTSYLRFRGITGKGGIVFNDTDVELRQAITESVKSSAEAGKTLIDSRVVTRQEVRTGIKKGALDFSDIPEDLPPEIADELEVVEPSTDTGGDTDDEN